MAGLLPQEIIDGICSALATQHDFGTLFTLAISGKYTAETALQWMYRIHTHASVRGGEYDQTEMARTGAANTTHYLARVAQQQNTVSRWAVQWRSIILSSLGHTSYPYCLYIQCLDLENLVDLLDDDIFYQSQQEMFFSGQMEKFHVYQEPPAKRQRTRTEKASRPRRVKLDNKTIIDNVGECISSYVGEQARHIGGTGHLEELHGRMSEVLLSTWVGRLPRLKYMRLWDGIVLNKSIAQTISLNCPNFSQLNLYLCTGASADANMSDFVSGLRPNTLEILQVNSRNQLGAETFLALAHHRESLQELTLGNLEEKAVKQLNLLAGCTALRSLSLQDDIGIINLEATENDVWLGFVDWLTSCKQLKRVRLDNFVNGPGFVTALCSADNIQLSSLSLLHYVLVGNQILHQAMANQTGLDTLELHADATDCARDDVDTLVESLCTLSALKDLKLLEISDDFRSAQVQQLAISLPRLEYLTISGEDINDDVFPALATMHHLQNIAFNAVTFFTFSGIMSYISELKDTNNGLQFSVLCAAQDSDLNERQVGAIRDAIAAKVDGRFDFQLYRDPGMSGSEDFSD